MNQSPVERWILDLQIRQKASKEAGGVIQCDACLLYFKSEEVCKVCECGAYLCHRCQARGATAACYCDC